MPRRAVQSQIDLAVRAHAAGDVAEARASLRRAAFLLSQLDPPLGQDLVRVFWEHLQQSAADPLPPDLTRLALESITWLQRTLAGKPTENEG